VTDSLLLEQLELQRGPVELGRAWIGRPQTPYAAARRIGPSQVELFASLVRDDDPRYWAKTERRPVPAGLLLSYTLPLPWSPAPQAVPLWARVPLPGDTLINVTTSTLFHREAHTGDVVTLDDEVVDVSARKTTRLGTGHFLTTRVRFTLDGEPLADHTNVMIRYDSDSPRAGRQDGGATPESTGEPGAADLTLPVTLELCVHNVAASGDFFPGHYDPAYARSQGVAGPYLNTMFFHGLADQLARRRDRSRHGPGRRLARRDLRMIASAVVGDLLEARTTAREDGAVDVEMRTARGPVARATVWFADKGTPDVH
jgi:acyl dehydratase